MYWKVLFLSTVLFSTIFVRDSTQTRRPAIENGVFGELPHGKLINRFSCATCHCTPKPVCKLPVLSPEVSLHSCLTTSPYMKGAELMNPLYAIESFSMAYSGNVGKLPCQSDTWVDESTVCHWKFFNCHCRYGAAGFCNNGYHLRSVVFVYVCDNLRLHPIPCGKVPQIAIYSNCHQYWLVSKWESIILEIILVDLSHNIVSHAHSIADHQATLTQAQKILRNILKSIISLYILLGIEKLSFMYRTPTELDKCITPTISVMTSVAVGLITIVEIIHTLQTGCPCIAMDGYRSCTVNERLVLFWHI